jgi:hypothetical protein
VEPIDYAAARAALQEVLARREFQRRDTSPWTDWIQKSLYQWMTSFLDLIGAGSNVTTATVARGLAWIIAMGALLVLVYWIWRMRAPRGTSRPLAIDAAPDLARVDREGARRAPRG